MKRSQPASLTQAHSFARKAQHAHISDFLLNFSVGHRLLIGFLTAAIITVLSIGITGIQRAQSFDQQARLYQSLIMTNNGLPLGNNLLNLMNIKIHAVLSEATARAENPGEFSLETQQDDERSVRDLTAQYQQILGKYQTTALLDQHPEQLAFLTSAEGRPQIDQQHILTTSAIGTWRFYVEAQSHILQAIDNRHINDAVLMEHLQGEPRFADALSALHGLIHFNQQLSATLSNSAAIQERDQSILTIVSSLLACVGITIAGLLISQTFVQRLNQLRSVTEGVKRGNLDTRLPVVGHDEITDVSASVNAMLETMVADAIAYEQQKQINQFKDQFIMSVSHELRTPITQIYGFLELLIDYHGQIDDTTQLGFLNRAKYGCQELIHLVNSVLDATRASHDATAPKLQDLLIKAIAQDVIDQLDPRHKLVYHIELDIQEELHVIADQQYLRQTIRNLVSNALKYCPKGSQITIGAKALAMEQMSEKDRSISQVYIYVQDTGPGIPPEEASQLFQRFARLKRDVSGTVRGTGLGLYVCKQLVEAMNGKIWVESTGIAGEGSTFCLTLPAPTNTSPALENHDSIVATR
jgi:signal transduction histidine kinase